MQLPNYAQPNAPQYGQPQQPQQPPMQPQYGQPQQPPMQPPMQPQYGQPQQPPMQPQYGQPQQPPMQPQYGQPQQPPMQPQYGQQPPMQPQYGQQPPMQPQYGQPPPYAYRPLPSMNTPSVINYAARVPFIPYKREEGAEGQMILQFKGLRLHQSERSSPAYRALVKCMWSNAPGVQANVEYEISFALYPTNVDAVGPIMQKLRSLCAAIEGAQTADPNFNADAARDKIIQQTQQGYFDQQQLLLILRQSCSISAKGKPVTQQDFQRYVAQQ